MQHIKTLGESVTFSGRTWIHSLLAAFRGFHKHSSKRTNSFKIYEVKLPGINKPKVAKLTRVYKCPNGGISWNKQFL